MPEVSLTVFVDFVTAGDPLNRATRVRLELNRGEYDPRTDFWKKLRERIQDTHQRGQPVRTLQGLLDEVTDQKKLDSYSAAITGYLRFIGRKRVSYFEPPRAEWEHGDLAVRVNPELGLTIRDQPHVIKLYFRKDPLSKRKVDAVLALMDDALADQMEPNAVVSVLDVQQAHVYVPTRQVADIDTVLAGEAASFLEMWHRLEER